jgi:hypothetical protein
MCDRVPDIKLRNTREEVVKRRATAEFRYLPGKPQLCIKIKQKIPTSHHIESLFNFKF